MLPRRAVASNLDGARRRLGVDRRGRPHPRPAALPRPRARARPVRPAAPRRRAAPPRPLRRRAAAARAAATARRCCSASRPCTTGSAARPSTTPRSPTACKQARLLVSGSAPLPAPEFTRIEQLTGQQIVERYGLTETLMNTAVRADSQRRPATSASRSPGVEVRLVDDDGNEHRRPPTTRRSARSPSAARTSSPATSTAPTPPTEAMRDGWFFTGDLATVARRTATGASSAAARPT